MSHKIIGIGNAIMDFLCPIKDDFLTKNQLLKGSMTLIDKNTLLSLNTLKIEKLSSGGSVANTINALSQLGNECSFIGSVANDIAGQKYIEDIEKFGTKFIGQIYNNKDTASSFVLITPDAQRTMCTYLGCAPIILEEHIQADFFSECKILYVEGYLWDSPATISAIRKAIKIAKNFGCKIAFSLSDSFCVERHRKDFIELIKNDIDILFANESEILSLTEHSFYSALGILDFLKTTKSNITVAITRNAKGCEIFNQNLILEIPTKIVQPIDTTGAGDSFASGFLHGIIRNYELTKCGEIGNCMAGLIIQKMGARFENSEILNLKNYIKL